MSEDHSQAGGPAVRIHLAQLGDAALDAPVRAFAELAARDPATQGRLTDDPDQAGVILFTQPHMLAGDARLRAITRHPLALRFPERVVVYDERDRPWGAFPGVYVNLPAGPWQPARFRAWGYYTVPELTGDPDVGVPDPDLLFSFVGSPTAPCREALFGLAHPDAVVERVDGFMFWDAASADFAARQRRFREILLRSRFVLCPRGHGTSSIRLYEVLAAGRVPVIISDDWVPPRGPVWPACSIRWPERRPEGLIAMLEQRSAEWPELARRAAEAYAEFFAPERSVGHIFDLCTELVSDPAAMAPARLRDPPYLRATLRLGLSTLRQLAAGLTSAAARR